MKNNIKKVSYYFITFGLFFMIIFFLGEVSLRFTQSKLEHLKPMFSSGKYLCEWNDSLIADPHVAYKYTGDSFCSFKHINSNGYFSSEFPVRSENKDHYNVLLLGGSVAFNLYVGQSRELNGYLKEVIETKYLGPNRKKIKLFSTAIPAWKQPQQLLSYILHGHQFDSVLSIEGYNEVAAFNKYNKFNTPQTMAWHIFFPSQYSVGQLGSTLKKLQKITVLIPLLKDSYLYTALYRSFRQAFFVKLESSKLLEHPIKFFSSNDEKYEDALKEYLGHLKTLKSLTEFNKQELAIFIQPTLYYAKPISDMEGKYSEMKELEIEQIYLKYKNLDKGLDLVNKDYVFNLTRVFEKETASIYYDPVHMGFENGKNLGHEIMVEKIMDGLVSKWGLIKKD
jgi:hypothetical protein